MYWNFKFQIFPLTQSCTRPVILKRGRKQLKNYRFFVSAFNTNSELFDFIITDSSKIVFLIFPLDNFCFLDLNGYNSKSIKDLLFFVEDLLPTAVKDLQGIDLIFSFTDFPTKSIVFFFFKESKSCLKHLFSIFLVESPPSTLLHIFLTRFGNFNIIFPALKLSQTIPFLEATAFFLLDSFSPSCCLFIPLASGNFKWSLSGVPSSLLISWSLFKIFGNPMSFNEQCIYILKNMNEITYTWLLTSNISEFDLEAGHPKPFVKYLRHYYIQNKSSWIEGKPYIRNFPQNDTFKTYFKYEKRITEYQGKHFLWYALGQRRHKANCNSWTFLFSPCLQTKHLWAGQVNDSPAAIFFWSFSACMSWCGWSSLATHSGW